LPSKRSGKRRIDCEHIVPRRPALV
jgi:hypothetical protein